LRQLFLKVDTTWQHKTKGLVMSAANFTLLGNPSFTPGSHHSRTWHAKAMEAAMSKLMFGFLMLCSVALYNPQGVRDFVNHNASEMGWQLKGALYSVDRMLPSFLRIGRG
jgi:hypothetical protein